MAKNNKYRSRDDHGYWETVNQLPTLGAKIEYTWDNWHVQILAVAFLIVLIVSVVVTNAVNHKNVYLHGDIVNILITDQLDSYEEGYLDRAFIRDHLQADPAEEWVMTYTGDLILDLNPNSDINALTSSDNSNASTSTITRLDAHVMAGEADYFILTENVIKWIHSRYGETFLDLRTFLTEEELAQYADRLVYAAGNVPVAIDLTGSEIIEKMGMVAESSVCFSWFAYVEEAEHMRPFFDFVMSTLP